MTEKVLNEQNNTIDVKEQTANSVVDNHAENTESNNGNQNDTDITSDDKSKESKKTAGNELKHGDKYNHPGSNNLVPMNEMTVERQRQIASMGGKASQAKARERKRAREIAQAILSAKMSDAQIEKILGTDKGVLGDDQSAYAVMIAKMLQTACEGDSRAATFVRDTAGDKPDDNVKMDATVTEGDKALMDKIAKRLGIVKTE